MILFRKLAYKLGLKSKVKKTINAGGSLPQFGNNPKNLEIIPPRTIRNEKNIFIGDDVKIGPYSVIKTSVEYPGGWMTTDKYPWKKQTFSPTLKIGNRVTATSNLQVNALHEIIIEDDVLFAANVFICDGLHGYTNVDIPFKYQPMFKIERIKIGRGSWIGQNVVVMPGVTIGEMAIIGANSVVTKNIPPKSIAVGVPAKVVKVWDEHLKDWKLVK